MARSWRRIAERAVNLLKKGSFSLEIGDHNSQIFAKLWQKIETWKSRRYLTDGYCVCANYINPEKHLVLPKTLLTRVERENTRLRPEAGRLRLRII